MKSIQTKIITVIIACVFLASACNSIAGLYATSRVLENEASEIMNLMCKQNAADMDTQFLQIEKSVEGLAVRAQSEVTDINLLWNDSAYMTEYTNKMEEAALSHAKGSGEVVAVFMAYNPEYADSKGGFFWTRDNAEEEFVQRERTDLLAYERTDQDVSWYYDTIDKGEAMWTMPYRDEYIEAWMISYVVPIYADDVLVGVVGMDINFEDITQAAKEVQIYETGFAFICLKDGTIMYHPDYPFMDMIGEKDESIKPIVAKMQNSNSSEGILKFELNGEKKNLAFYTLRDGMCFCIVVPEDEINSGRDTLIQQNAVITFVSICFTVIIGTVLSGNLVRPLKQLDAATREIVEGNWDVTLEKTTNDEVGQLTENFQKTLSYLNEYVEKADSMAYKDGMTGVRNKTAYQLMQSRLDERIQEGTARFAVVFFDLNNLKQVNDKYGHMAGDALICAASEYICRVFEESQVYRIGGDEFVAILETSDLEKWETLVETFKNGVGDVKLERYKKIKVSVACGASIFDPNQDKAFDDVFQRADALMYANKDEIKGKKR